MNNKDIKLKAVHSLVHDNKKPHITHIARSSCNTSIAEISSYTYPNLEILEICPTLQNSVLYTKQGSFGSENTYESNSQSLAGAGASSQQQFPPCPANINIKQCIQCAKQLDKCVCTNNCKACFKINNLLLK